MLFEHNRMKLRYLETLTSLWPATRLDLLFPLSLFLLLAEIAGTPLYLRESLLPGHTLKSQLSAFLQLHVAMRLSSGT